MDKAATMMIMRIVGSMPGINPRHIPNMENRPCRRCLFADFAASFCIFILRLSYSSHTAFMGFNENVGASFCGSIPLAAVVDLDGDGVADVLAVDENYNQQIDEGEVYDLSNDNVHMADYQDLYMAQQQQMQMDQEQNTFAYNASDDQPDYNNDADLSYV